MNFMNKTANIKQFQLIRYLNENCNDDYVISKISIVLRRDKIEAPYYMITKINLSTCVDMEENGLIHAMDILNHHRKYNLTEEKFNKIKSLITDKSDLVEISEKEKQLNMTLTAKNRNEFDSLYENYHELFNEIDNLIE